MLNEKTGRRMLAYTARIGDITPITGADNIELVAVQGWHCIAKKGEFQPGDRCVYFEIDSKVPAADWFEFLSSKQYKVKTMKLSKFGVVSQGLTMPVSVFGDIIPDGDYVDCTDLLGVTHIVDDTDRVPAPVAGDFNAKCTSMKARHPKLFRTKFARWMMRREWGRRVMVALFGRKKTPPTTWPVGKFPGVSQTDQERCLPGGTRILTENGWTTISMVVNQQLPVKVASRNPDGTMSWKRILQYQKFDNHTPMVTIRYPYRPGVKKSGALCCTADHKILTARGYVEAKDVTIHDQLFMPVYAYDETALAPLYGMLLGDSYIARDKRSNGLLRVGTTHGEKQLDYLKYKRAMFNDEGSICNAGVGSFGTRPTYAWAMPTDAYISAQLRQDWYVNNTKEITDNVLAKLTDVSLAFWYLDDGCLSYSSPNKTAYFVRLNSQGFSLEDNERLCNMLQEKFAVHATVHKDKIAKDGHQMYAIGIYQKANVSHFFDLIAPYIPDSMLYKLPEQWHTRQFHPLSYTKSYRTMQIPVISVEDGQTKNKTWSKNFSIVYDIEVEDNHNFIAENIVVHNCENEPQVLQEGASWIRTEKCDGSSGTYILARKGRRFEFYVCSRRVRMVDENQDCFHGYNYYWEVARKYDIERKMKMYLNDHPELTFVCWQGEICAPNIQKNPHHLTSTHFYCFHWTDDTGRWDIRRAADVWKSLSMEVVPIEREEYKLPATMEEMKATADGYYDPSVCEGKADCPREGYVYYRVDNPAISFKNVSIKYLCRNK